MLIDLAIEGVRYNVLPVNDDSLTPDELARELGLQSSLTILRRIRAGALDAEKVGRGYRITRAEAERLKRRLRHKKSSPSYREKSVERSSRIRARFAPLPGLPGSGSSS
jgi:excisionase family DNA binding protein